jgi:hypothetical protein
VTFLGIALGLGRPAEAQWIAAPLREVARLARRALGDERWIAPLEELSARCEAAGLEPTDAADVARGR